MSDGEQSVGRSDVDVRDAALAELVRPRRTASPWDRVSSALGGRRPPPWLRLASVMVAVAVSLGAWVVLRRPPDPLDTLPRATESTATPSDRPGSDPSTTPGGAAASSTVLPVDGDPASAGSPGFVTVHVAGAVIRPGVVSLPEGSRAVDAVQAAGGLAPGADPDRVNLAAPLADGVRLAIPLVGQPVPPEVAPQPAGSSATSGSSGGSGTAPVGPVDLNTADVGQLDQLPGVGPSTATAIVDHREQNGPFASVDSLLDVRGIGEAKLDALRDLVTVGS